MWWLIFGPDYLAKMSDAEMYAWGIGVPVAIGAGGWFAYYIWTAEGWFYVGYSAKSGTWYYSTAEGAWYFVAPGGEVTASGFPLAVRGLFRLLIRYPERLTLEGASNGAMNCFWGMVRELIKGL